MTFSGLESESPVRWRNRRVGTGMGWAGGRAAVEFGLTEGEDEPDEDEDDWSGGDCDRETASAWTAFSTFLQLLFQAMKK